MQLKAHKSEATQSGSERLKRQMKKNKKNPQIEMYRKPHALINIREE